MREPSPTPPELHGRIVESDFRPHPLIRNPHLQTVLASQFRPMPPLPIRRERVELPDGDFVDLGWSGEANTHGPIAVLVHGLAGGFDSKYLRGLALRLIAYGWRIAILQLRGSGPEPNRLPQCYHHGDTADLRYVWRLLHSREPDVRLASAGWSLGANVLLKALGEEGNNAVVSAAVASCAPFRLQECAERLQQGLSRGYQNHLLKALKASVRRKHATVPLPTHIDLSAALRARDFIEFDNAYTAPLHGYRDAKEYYARTACGQFLGAVRRPTLIVNALDDPFMVPSIMPDAPALSPYVTLELARYGGHVGFLSAGPGGRPMPWLEEHFATFLQQALAG